MAIKYRYPLNIDVVLIAIVYYAIGFYGKELLNKLSKKYIVFGVLVGLVASSVLLYLGKNILLDYNLDMKYSQYRNLILDLAIPLLFTITIILISMIIQEFKVLRKIGYLGENTLFIMYLHILLNEILSDKFHYGYGIYIVIGVVLPIMFSLFIKQFKLINYIFTGKYNVLVKVRKRYILPK
jgi:fucose 4-O-acetylase-like acetyltransferase